MARTKHTTPAVVRSHSRRELAARAARMGPPGSGAVKKRPRRSQLQVLLQVKKRRLGNKTQKNEELIVPKFEQGETIVYDVEGDESTWCRGVVESAVHDDHLRIAYRQVCGDGSHEVCRKEWRLPGDVDAHDRVRRAAHGEVFDVPLVPTVAVLDKHLRDAEDKARRRKQRAAALAAAPHLCSERAEAQHRGGLHVHSLVWNTADDAPAGERNVCTTPPAIAG